MASPTSDTRVRVVGRRPKANSDPIDIFRYSVTGNAPDPNSLVERFTLGTWRHRIGTSDSVIALVSDVQRGMRVELPATFARCQDFANVERVHVAYVPEIANAVVGDHGTTEAWLPVVATTEMFLVTLTKFTLGESQWFIVESGSVCPEAGRPALFGGFVNAVQASIFVNEQAARKAFTELTRPLEDKINFRVPVDVGLPLDKKIAAGLALTWMEKHAAEDRQRRAEAAAAAAEAARLVEVHAAEAKVEAERQARIQAGDVTILDDRSLAARLHAKRKAAS